MSTEPASKLRAGLDPRRRIYRDPFNEQLVFLLSAVPAAVVNPLILLGVGAIAGKFDVVVFVAASIALELFFIFGLGRPQMKPMERVGWALLWSFAAAFFAVCFYYLVFDVAL